MDADGHLAASRRALDGGQKLDDIAASRLFHANRAALQVLLPIASGNPAASPAAPTLQRLQDLRSGKLR